MSTQDNITNMQLLDEPIDFNLEAEPAGLAKTKIPDGTYLCTLAPGKFGIKTKVSNGKAYVSAHVEGKIVAPGEVYDGWRVSGFISSLAFADGTSPLQQLLLRSGYQGQIQSTRDLLAATEDVLVANPQVYGRVRWEAQVKDEDGKWHRIKGMKKFPQNTDGSYNPFVELAGEEVEARETLYAFAKAPAGAGA